MVEYDFENKVAFVTGAARGQGRAHAIRYAEHGATVVVADVGESDEQVPYETATEEDVTETTETIRDRGGTVLPLRMDVTDEREVASAVERAVGEFGHIDFLVNNAGIAPVSSLLELDEATWNATIDVNLKGMWLCAKFVAKHMRTRGEGGRIVNISSVAGLAASPGLGHYSTAKHGVVGLTKNLAAELAREDITVNAVCPTAVETPMVSQIVDAMDDDLADVAAYTQPDSLFGEILTPEDVSAAVMWLSSEDARLVTGIALPVDAGATSV